MNASFRSYRPALYGYVRRHCGRKPASEIRVLNTEYHGYSGANKIFHVVHDHERSSVARLDRDVRICARSGLPNTKQMVSYTPRDPLRGHVLVPWIVQDCLFGFQSCSLLGTADNCITKAHSKVIVPGRWLKGLPNRCAEFSMRYCARQSLVKEKIM